MQNESWMQPALRTGEAVLLPALDRCRTNQQRYGNHFLPSYADDAFLPARESWETDPPPSSGGIVPPCGSMAGRSVLRAAGLYAEPIARLKRHTCSFKSGKR